ncbi:MAG: DUF5615 family PIN-like protein [Phycisphaerales bacterium]|nr:DUF5615 family PIN-like protein [Phycisphaerales bacterium]
MPSRFKIDEDLPAEIALELRHEGHDALTVLEEALAGESDETVWRAAQDEHRVLITADKGFGDIRRFQPGTHSGILLLRLQRESGRGYIALVQKLAASGVLDRLPGVLTVATPSRLRTYRS